MNNPNRHRLPEPNPVTMKRHHRQVWWQVLFPVVLGALILIAVSVLATLASDTTIIRSSDISLILLILPAAVVGLVVFVLLAGLVYLMARLLRVMPHYTRLAQDTLDGATAALKRVSDKAASPVINLESILAGLRSLFKRQQNV
jgi:predicted PurR-regulated permease PerM